MISARNPSQARFEAAASIQWPQGTPFLLNPDPVVRRKFVRFSIALAALLFALVVAIDPSSPFRKWERSVESGELRPAMEAAMNHGNRAAGTWLALHYAKEYPGLIEQEAVAGEPTAMYVVGALLLNSDNPGRFVHIDPAMTKQQLREKGLALIRSAAAAGNLGATIYLSKHDE